MTFINVIIICTYLLQQTLIFLKTHQKAVYMSKVMKEQNISNKDASDQEVKTYFFNFYTYRLDLVKFDSVF